MFATQQYLEAVDAGRKRFRDEEDLALGTAGFVEHNNKRFQTTLPLRNSNRVPQQYFSQTIVPLNASPAEAGPRHTTDSWTSDTMNNSAHQADAETNFMGATHSTSCRLDNSVGGVEAQHDSSSIERMSTPTQPSFASQVKASQAAWAAAPTVPSGIVNLGHHVTGICQDKCVPRAMNGSNLERQMLQNQRRLPSPISEVSNSVVNSQACASNAMVMDHDGCLDAQPHFPAGFLSSPSCQSSLKHTMAHPNAMMGDRIRSNLSQNSKYDADTLPPSPRRKGHQRSKHTINTWTWQPGMKKSLSIGYRSDCEKCQHKVPGHFNHIVIS